MPHPSTAPLEGLDDLLRPFHEAEKPRSHWRIGTEAEKFGILADVRAPLPYEGPRSVLKVFERLVERHGWFEEREYEGGEVISLRRGETSITLEPGAQFELSGAPQETVHLTCAEFRAHMAELADISQELGIVWLGLGFHPFATQDDLPWVPKLRYRVMREYLPTRGSMALDMMRRTATVQANLDWSDEADAVRKLRVGMRLAPIVNAMFANSPIVEGKLTGERTRRGAVWLNMDPDRSGILRMAWEDDLSYRKYVEWALDVPMFLIKRGGELVLNTGQTFRDFLANGFEGHRATMADWEGHLGTLFPEIRMKRTLEVRSADSQDTAMVCALPALWKGLLYDEQALAEVERLVDALSFDDVQAARLEVPEHALRAKLAGRELAEWAVQVLDIAEGGLGRISNLNPKGEDERVHLRKLDELVRKGKTPADLMVEAIREGGDLFSQVLDLAKV